jgi:hypothetical protein
MCNTADRGNKKIIRPVEPFCQGTAVWSLKRAVINEQDEEKMFPATPWLRPPGDVEVRPVLPLGPHVVHQHEGNHSAHVLTYTYNMMETTLSMY